MQVILNSDDIEKIKDALDIAEKYMRKLENQTDSYEYSMDELKIYDVRGMLP